MEGHGSRMPDSAALAQGCWHQTTLSRIFIPSTVPRQGQEERQLGRAERAAEKQEGQGSPGRSRGSSGSLFRCGRMAELLWRPGYHSCLHACLHPSSPAPGYHSCLHPCLYTPPPPPGSQLEPAGSVGFRPLASCLRSSRSWMKPRKVWVSMKTSRKRRRLLEETAFRKASRCRLLSSPDVRNKE